MSSETIDFVSRRGFMAKSVAGAAMLASGALGAQRGPRERGQDQAVRLARGARARQRRRPFGLQLYSVRQDCQKDLPGTIAAVGKMGYQGVEFAGYYGRSAKELRKMLDDNGLKCCGTHTGVDTLLGDNLAKAVEFNQTLGNQYLIVPGFPEKYRSSRQAWLETAKLMNELSDKVKPDGMRVGYHNHGVEFQAMDGELPWDTFFSNTNKDVIMQLDVGNAMDGGADPLPYLYKYPERAITVHVKEFSKTNNNTLIGEGDVPWEAFFALCRAVGGTEWYIVEYEREASPPLESVKLCLQNLRKMRFAY
jgi:sugar phosphate isomerase/epimerase